MFFEDDGENGMNRLFDELATYSRVLDDAGEPIEKIKDKERYHCLDALRYDIAATTDIFESAMETIIGKPFTFSDSPY